MPLMLSHGWPGSVVEFLDVIGPLTDPAAHGGDPRRRLPRRRPRPCPATASRDRPPAGLASAAHADAFARLMADLGYDRYGAQGGDWGSHRLGQPGRCGTATM